MDRESLIETQNLVVTAFREFLNEEIPECFSNYESESGRWVVQVFTVNPEEDNAFLDLAESQRIVLPIGKVLEGDGLYEPGDIVKLNDYSVGTIENPRYEAWVNNPYNKSSMDRVGTEPPQRLQNCLLSNVTSIFKANPLSIMHTTQDFYTYDFTKRDIVRKIKDPEVFIQDIFDKVQLYSLTEVAGHA